ncbi:histone H1-like repetitive region-containing protein [Micromonospora sp. NPDC049374]|uniref:phasin family protein n=1 Tax=Micromonospora sp. NPDC049374 TaxID=3154352 RepID=UPI003426AAC8
MQDAWRAYLELAMGLTEAPRKKAQDAVRRAMGSTGATAAQLQTLAEELRSTGAANREALTKLVRFEVERALGAVGLATAEEVTELDRRVRELERQLRAASGTPASGTATAPGSVDTPSVGTPSTAAAAPPTKAVAKKAVAEKAVAKKAVAKKAIAKKAIAKKAVAKKAVAKKTVAEKAGGTVVRTADGEPTPRPTKAAPARRPRPDGVA